MTVVDVTAVPPSDLDHRAHLRRAVQLLAGPQQRAQLLDFLLGNKARLDQTAR